MTAPAPSTGARPAAARPTRARQQLVQHITACWRTQALHSAVLLDLPDRLAGGACTAADLAPACGCTTDGLQRLLRALCTLQVCRESRTGRFELTEAGQTLCRNPADGASSLRAMALWWGGPLWPMWGELAYSVRSGHSARARQGGAAHYAFLDGQPEAATLFHDAMQAMTALITQDVAQLETWRDARTLVDVGGGIGTLGVAVATAHARLQLTVLDRADAGAGAQQLFERHALGARARFVAGDFFAHVPAGADRYLLKSILHNWDDAACARLLAHCAAAAPRQARLLLVERVRRGRLRPGRHDQALARTDLNMLAGLGGRERSLNEFAALLVPAGFDIVKVVATRHEFSVIETVRR
ncbi:MAG: hypothetical protein RLZZ584_375 [Pseudomonadota bacterium]|jgi:hypothetical protein